MDLRESGTKSAWGHVYLSLGKEDVTETAQAWGTDPEPKLFLVCELGLLNLPVSVSSPVEWRCCYVTGGIEEGTTVSAPGSCGRSAHTGSFLFPEAVPRPSFPELMGGVSRNGDIERLC